MATQEATGRPDASEGGGTLARVQAACQRDLGFYAPRFLKVNFNQEYVPFELRPAQARLWSVLAAQRDRGEPMRAIILKARKMGFSTFAQALMVQRATQLPNHNALTVAQDGSTAQELFRIGETMYGMLPNDPELAWCKPNVVWTRRGRELHFGEGSRKARSKGDLGLNSKLLVDTANEFSAGRGFTNHTLHLSELAFWADIKTKLTSLLNTVPASDPNTLVLIESTPNGYNEFHRLWTMAEKGDSEYYPFFAAWHEDPTYKRAFPDQVAAEQFEDQIGRGPWGADEPELRDRLLDAHGDPVRALEQLHWRRWAIEARASGDLDTFRQEYPSFPDEGFIGTGKTVFAANHIRRVREIAQVTEQQAERVWLEPGATSTKAIRAGTIHVPAAVKEREWRDNDRGDHYWRIYHRPGSEGTSGHFIVIVDPAAGEENTAGESDYTGIQVIDWKTRVQCAQLQSYCEPATAAEQAFLVAMHYRQDKNLPLVVVEVTGGYGNWIAQRIWRELGWRNMYYRKNVDPRQKERQTDLVGFMTDRGSKPMLVDTGRDILSEEDPGIRSLLLADELRTYVRDSKGKTGAEDGSHDDLLMPWLIGQYVAGVKPPRDRKAGGVISTTTYRGQAASVIGRR